MAKMDHDFIDAPRHGMPPPAASAWGSTAASAADQFTLHPRRDPLPAVPAGSI